MIWWDSLKHRLVQQAIDLDQFLLDEIQIYRVRTNLSGVSMSSAMTSFLSSAIIFLYLIDDTGGGGPSRVVLWSLFGSCSVSAWKVCKLLSPKLSTRFPFVTIRQVEHVSKGHATAEYDRIAVVNVAMVLYPLVIGWALFALRQQHSYQYKSWWSWFISNLANAVYTFGFVTLCPRLYANYRLKSVAHLPWKVFMYKIFHTFVDDAFAWLIEMPWRHRIMTLRGDVAFLLFLVQFYFYRDDKTWTNEYGYAYAHACEEPRPPLGTQNGSEPILHDFEMDHETRAQVEALASAILRNEVAEIDLSQRHIGDEGVGMLCEALRQCGNYSSILKLDLSVDGIVDGKPRMSRHKNPIGRKGVAVLCSALQRMSSLQVLNLSNKDYGIVCCGADLTKAIRNLKCLKHLDLSCCRIGNFGAVVLAEALPNMKSLVKLNLSSHDIYENGAIALFQALREIPWLTKLGLHGIALGYDDGVIPLLEALEALGEKNILTNLSLYTSSAMPRRLSMGICESLRAMISLVQLELAQTRSINEYDLGGESGALARALNGMTALTKLKIAGYNFQGKYSRYHYNSYQQVGNIHDLVEALLFTNCFV